MTCLSGGGRFLTATAAQGGTSQRRGSRIENGADEIPGDRVHFGERIAALVDDPRGNPEPIQDDVTLRRWSAWPSGVSGSVE